MARVTYYYRRSDTQAEETKQKIKQLAEEAGFSVIDICLDDEPELSSYYDDITPALQIGPYRLKYPFNEKDIIVAFSAYREHVENNPVSDEEKAKKDAKLLKVSPLERFSFWLSNYYVLFITGILILFLGLPFMAPVLKEDGHSGGAEVIYRIYSVFCHQLSFRSYFFYGEQAYYPRELAHIQGVITYEQATGKSALDTAYARIFEGNSVMGYKVAICERDIAIYGSLILFGLFFHFSKRKMKALPWYLWVIFAIIPIAIDGGSQLFSLGGTWPAWFPVRESTPLLRTITGALFGVGTAWYVFPMMEESMIQTRTAMARKLAIKKRLSRIESEK
jgi:uncharacterized membrane protein